jgi:hypothetical protein
VTQWVSTGPSERTLARATIVFAGAALRADCPTVVFAGAALRADCPTVVFAGAALRADCPTVVFAGAALRADTPTYSPLDHGPGSVRSSTPGWWTWADAIMAAMRIRVSTERPRQIDYWREYLPERTIEGTGRPKSVDFGELHRFAPWLRRKGYFQLSGLYGQDLIGPRRSCIARLHERAPKQPDPLAGIEWASGGGGG